MHVVLLLLITILLSANQAFAISTSATSATVPSNAVSGVCFETRPKYVRYNATVTSGSLSGIYFAPKSVKDAAEKTKTFENALDFDPVYQLSASCPSSGTRVTSCVVGYPNPILTGKSNETFCIVFSNTNSTGDAGISITYEALDSNTPSSNGTVATPTPTPTNILENHGTPRFSTEYSMTSIFIAFIITIFCMTCFVLE